MRGIGFNVALMASSLGCAPTHAVTNPQAALPPRPRAAVESRPAAEPARTAPRPEEARTTAAAPARAFAACGATNARSRPLECWLPALENYIPTVKAENQAPINSARSLFASYANRVHDHIHPIFADKFLVALGSLPPTDPMNQPSTYTTVELVLDGERGSITRMGIVRSSGITAFDVAALESAYRAQPFGQPPPSILSSDGNVYFHWQFHRGVEECGPANARPFILRVQQ